MGCYKAPKVAHAAQETLKRTTQRIQTLGIASDLESETVAQGY